MRLRKQSRRAESAFLPPINQTKYVVAMGKIYCSAAVLLEGSKVPCENVIETKRPEVSIERGREAFPKVSNQDNMGKQLPRQCNG